MSLAKKLYYTICSGLPMGQLKNIAGAKTLFPYHHTVSDYELLHIKHLYNYKNVSQFKKDLDTLLKHFKPVSADDFLNYFIKNNTAPENSFLLSFDDGFKEVYHVIAPILESKGIPAIFFINPAFIDNKELFFRSKTSLLIHEMLTDKSGHLNKLFQKELQLSNADNAVIINTLKSSKQLTDISLNKIAESIGYSYTNYLEKEKPFLTTVQVSELKARGFSIGAHSWDHPYYPDLDLDEQAQQTITSCAYVQAHFTEANKYFSFPYSDEALTQGLFDQLKKSDIALYFGIQNQKEEQNNRMFHRFNAERPVISLDKQLKGLLMLMTLNKLMKKNKVIRN